MSDLAYIVTDGGITAIIGGEEHAITRDNPSYQEVVGAIVAKEDPDQIADLFRTANAVKRYSQGAITVSADGCA
ncbi:MAG TPA: hypothetical protein VKH37_03520, partial [Ferruginibacter sp.]|nr:hypothetical protein [Ferruginibacter sp.]